MNATSSIAPIAQPQTVGNRSWLFGIVLIVVFSIIGWEVVKFSARYFGPSFKWFSTFENNSGHPLRVVLIDPGEFGDASGMVVGAGKTARTNFPLVGDSLPWKSDPLYHVFVIDHAGAIAWQASVPFKGLMNIKGFSATDEGSGVNVTPKYRTPTPEAAP